MFCPKCSQQQPSEEVRFCPKCGFSLAGVAALVSANDAQAISTDAARAAEQSAKRADVRRGAKFMFFSLVLTPVFLGLSVMFDTPVFLFIPLTLFLAGLMWMLYSALFGEEILSVRSLAARNELRAGGQTPALDAPQFVPAPYFSPRRVNTSEITSPPSVTENTTRLLDKDDRD
jgi:hypothetical protein